MESHSNQEPIKYVRELLNLSPETDTQRIVYVRSAHLGAESPSVPEVQRRNRESIGLLKNILDQCSRSFWKTGLDDVGAILASGQFSNAMEVSAASQRMLAWHRLRDRIYELREVLGRYSLAIDVHRLAPLRTREAEAFKQHVLSEIRKGNFKSYRDDAQAIKEKFPDIYALDSEWFEDIIHSRRLGWFSRLTQRSAAAKLNVSPGYQFPSWIIFVLVIFAIKTLIAMSLAKR